MKENIGKFEIVDEAQPTLESVAQQNARLAEQRGLLIDYARDMERYGRSNDARVRQKSIDVLKSVGEWRQT